MGERERRDAELFSKDLSVRAVALTYTCTYTHVYTFVCFNQASPICEASASFLDLKTKPPKDSLETISGQGLTLRKFPKKLIETTKATALVGQFEGLCKEET